MIRVWMVVASFALSLSAVLAKPRDERPYPQMKREPAPFVIVTNEVHIPTAWKFNPIFWFKNYDDPEPPEKMWPGDPHRHFKWYWRNPFHNFTFYVIGIADKTFVRTGKYPARVFAPDGGWNWTVSKYKWLRLPFVSYQSGSFHFYCGWRNRGNFGFEFKFSEPKEKPVPKAERSQSAGGGAGAR
jgi:hypothetical protein